MKYKHQLLLPYRVYQPGGPHKEFFRLVLMEIKSTYFDHGLQELMRENYTLIGIIFGRYQASEICM